MLAELLLVSTMTFQVTSYRSVPEQTDSTPFHTSTGERVREGFCAVSQDVLGKQVHYGDILFVEVPAKPELSRYCLVADTMNKRHKMAVDFWVSSYAEEKKVQVRVGRVYKLKQPRGASMQIPQDVAREVFMETIRIGNQDEAYKTIRNRYIQDTILLKSQILSRELFIQDTHKHIDELINNIKKSKNQLKGTL